MAQDFDELELLQRVNNDVAFLAETVSMLEADGPSLMSEINAALDAGNAAAVGRAAHALKGMVSNFCAPVAQTIALEVESAAKAGDCAAAASAAARLEPRLDALICNLREFVKARA